MKNWFYSGWATNTNLYCHQLCRERKSKSLWITLYQGKQDNGDQNDNFWCKTRYPWRCWFVISEKVANGQQPCCLCIRTTHTKHTLLTGLNEWHANCWRGASYLKYPCQHLVYQQGNNRLLLFEPFLFLSPDTSMFERLLPRLKPWSRHANMILMNIRMVMALYSVNPSSEFWITVGRRGSRDLSVRISMGYSWGYFLSWESFIFSYSWSISNFNFTFQQGQGSLGTSVVCPHTCVCPL
jgi:hypothetical protein